MDNLQAIKELLSEAMASDSSLIIRNIFYNLNQELKKYLKKLDSFYQNIENQTRPIVSQYEALNATKEVISYSVFKQLNYSSNEIEQLLKEGYVLIDILRTFFTGERVNYLIGIPYRGTLYEQTISLEELLNYSQVTYNTKAKADNLFKLRMTGKKDLRQSFQENQQTVETNMKNSSTVWSSIARYVQGQGSDFKNKGNAYEVYRLIVSERGGSNTPPPKLPSAKAISDAFDKVRSNTVSSVKGGDYLQTQIKYFSSAPSIVTTSLIRSTLTEISQSFEQFSSNKDLGTLKTQMKNLFIKETSQAADAIEKEGIREIDEYIEELFKKFDTD